MAITKNSIVSMSLATLLTVAGGLWITIEKVQGGFSQIAMNAEAIQGVVKSIELSRIDRLIENKQKEIRDKRIAILEASDNASLVLLLEDQILELQNEIAQQKTIRACVEDPMKKVCQ